jgi:phage-related protein
VPQTEVYFYCDLNGQSEVFEWLVQLRARNSKAFIQCLAKLRLLRMFGYELRRPAVDYLQDGIYELRAKQGTVQYRLLYFFHGRNVAIVAHGITKKKTIPAIEIERAIERRRLYEKESAKHRFPKDVQSFDAQA